MVNGGKGIKGGSLHTLQSRDEVAGCVFCVWLGFIYV